jgi:DNA-directed RNA polymerase subunit RPC12/RpoP
VDIENEIAVAKLTPEDAASLRATYEREALDAIDRLEVVSRHAPLEDELEAEIAAARARLRCPDCGAPRKNSDACANCGREFVEPGR